MIRTLFLLITLFAFSIHANAQDMYSVKADKLNVRESSSPKSKIIGFIPQNENVMVLDSSNAEYFKIKVKNAEGWVSSSYLIKIANAPVKAAVKTPASIVIKPNADHSNLIIFVAVVLILVTALFFAFKYGGQHKLLVAFAVVAALSIGYFCYAAFLKERAVSGLFTSNGDTQYQSFNFKAKDSVQVKDTYADTLFTAHYVIQGDMIKLQQQENTILLMIIDEHTLFGEGFTKGIFKKN